MKENPLLQIKGIKKAYGDKQVLNGIQMTINEGDIYGLLGPNGVGKTTTLKSILGLVSVDAGEFVYKGKNWKGNRSNNCIFGASIDEPVFYNHLSGIENLRVFGSLVGIQEKEIIRIMKDFDLYDARNEKVKNYSQGMRQRLAISRVFLNNPEVIILDEPTNGLDPNGIKYMRALIRRLSEEFGKTVILSTHLLGEAWHTCTKIGIIRNGTVVVEESIEEVSKKVGNDIDNFEEFFIKYTEDGIHE